MTQYAMKQTISGSLETVQPRVVEALKTQGFGILTEIDVQKTLREKIGAVIEPFIILGACNPHFAHQAISTDPAIGLLLPCNVVLRQIDEKVEVSIIDPEMMFAVVDPATRATLAALPTEVKARMQPKSSS